MEKVSDQLELAAATGNFEEIEQIFEEHPKDLKKADNNRALLKVIQKYKCGHGYYECAEILLGRGAHPNSEEQGRSLNLIS